MHVRVRTFGKPETIVVVESKLTKIEQFRKIIRDKFDVVPKLQRLFYGGKLLENGYTFHDYNIKLNDVIQLMVKLQPDEDTKKEPSDSKKIGTKGVTKEDDKEIVYKDAESTMYSIGDLVDMRDMEQGAWFEGKITRIVYDPESSQIQHTSSPQSDSSIDNDDSKPGSDKESDLENKPPEDASSSEAKAKKKGIARYFTKSPKNVKKKQPEKESNGTVAEKNIEGNMLYKVQLDSDEDDSKLYCKSKDIRPRARNVIDIKDLKVGQKVMINHNTEEPMEKGYWYDFKIAEITKLRTCHELLGTLYLGPEAVPQNDTKVRVLDKIFAIEEVIPLAQRTEEYSQMMRTQPEKRAQPLNCLTCRDDEDTMCKDCGCYICSGKEFPEKIVLCDECNNGYHMTCLSPPMKELPEEDWYCPSCKRDTNDVIAPGASKQAKKANTSSRDWGRGMACVGKTKTCAMPSNHFGPIPGIEVGMCWRYRIQVSETGVHRPPVSGIHGRDVEGAYSIVLSGGYEDDFDYGNEFTYTGSGGRDLSGNKRTAGQSCDQTLTRENRALARNCAVKVISEEGGDAGDKWREGKPVRVVRSYKMMKHFPQYAPKEGIRYDGIYKVVKYYPEQGLSGYRVWKYLLRRDDPSPAPWDPDAKQYTIVYPDGYLEAEAEKKTLKAKSSKAGKGKGAEVAKKRALRESNQSESGDEPSPPAKKRKIRPKDDSPKRKEKNMKSKTKQSNGKMKIPNIFTVKSTDSSENAKKTKEPSTGLSTEEREAIEADSVNAKLWEACTQVCEDKGKKEFIEQVTQEFLCIICQEVAVCPVTTPCLHNFCMGCIKLAFKSTGAQTCPCCRNSLAKYEPELNEKLRCALRLFLPGYDSGKK